MQRQPSTAASRRGAVLDEKENEEDDKPTRPAQSGGVLPLLGVDQGKGPIIFFSFFFLLSFPFLIFNFFLLSFSPHFVLRSSLHARRLREVRTGMREWSQIDGVSESIVCVGLGIFWGREM